MTASIVLLVILLGLIWFLFLSRLSWRRAASACSRSRWRFSVCRAWLRVDARWTVAAPKLPGAGKRQTHRASENALRRRIRRADAVAGLADVPQYLGRNRAVWVRDVKLARDGRRVHPRNCAGPSGGRRVVAFAVVGGRAFTQEQPRRK